MARSLYICYFGVREPLVQTQVIPYLRELVRGGHDVTLLTFEPKGADEQGDVAETKSKLASDGIEWLRLRYHKRPSVPATMYDLAAGARYIAKLTSERHFDILHCRAHVPMVMAALARRLSWHKPKLLFDIRGFVPEEYVEAGVWPENGSIYKTFKRVEKWIMQRADGFVVLTETARDILFPEAAATGADKQGRPVEVIPCCLDFSRMKVRVEDRDRIRKELGWSERFVITHIGSLGGLYLTDEIVGLMAAAKKRHANAFALILTQRGTEAAAEKLEAAGFDANRYLVKSVGSDEILNYLVAADASVSIVKRSYSSAARSPTKIAEYLAAGLPLISSPGVGDTDRLVEQNDVGVILQNFAEDGFDRALETVEELLGQPGQRTRLQP